MTWVRVLMLVMLSAGNGLLHAMMQEMEEVPLVDFSTKGCRSFIQSIDLTKNFSEHGIDIQKILNLKGANVISFRWLLLDAFRDDLIHIHSHFLVATDEIPEGLVCATNASNAVYAEAFRTRIQALSTGASIDVRAVDLDRTVHIIVHRPTSIALSSCGRYLLATAEKRILEMWDLQEKKYLGGMKFEWWSSDSVTLSKSGEYLMAIEGRDCNYYQTPLSQKTFLDLYLCELALIIKLHHAQTSGQKAIVLSDDWHSIYSTLPFYLKDQWSSMIANRGACTIQ